MPLWVDWLCVILAAAAVTDLGRCGALYRAEAGSGTTHMAASGGAKVRRCEGIAVQMCLSSAVGYNATATPNLVGHWSQADAEHELNSFQPLLRYGCSSRLRLFLCAAYVPLCAEAVRSLVGPCRPLCEDVRRRCEPVLNRFGFSWPSWLHCRRFPPRNDETHMCMEGPAVVEQSDTGSTRAAVRQPPAAIRRASSSTPAVNLDPRPDMAASTSGSGCSNSPAYVYVNRTRRCSIPCGESRGTFTAGEMRFVEMWMTVWSIPSFISTLFTVLSFLVDTSRCSNNFDRQFFATLIQLLNKRVIACYLYLHFVFYVCG